MDRDNYCGVLFLMLIIFLIGFPVWCGVYFGIYYPLEVKSWHSSTCTIMGITSYTTSYMRWHTYVQYKVAVEVDGKSYPGYGCSSSGQNDRPDTLQIENTYAYKYSHCGDYWEFGDKCRSSQKFLPRWMCTPLEGAGQFLVGEKVDCKWYLNSDDGETDPANIDEFTYPGKSGTTIEVLFSDGINYPIDDYNATWVIPFGILSVIPCIFIIFCALPGLMGGFQKSKWNRAKDYCSDCCAALWCKKGYIPSRIRNLKPNTESIFKRKAGFLYVYLCLKNSGLPIKERYIRDIADYIG
ncbi:unnamed protein product [Blepharisma stoltei]|uniref:Uncharacterized protein n=1 Tax=Blepharisma stoltei TaxID=1481888 RepID=A0AAU9IWX9_9CILI|nr:unnamed protein product [Blepharisma stoltei]